MGRKPTTKTEINEVRVGSKIHSFLINAVKKYRSNSTRLPQIYLLGKSKRRGIIQDAVLLKPCGGGCSNMPSIAPQSLHKAYISLVRKNLIPCGLARVAHQLPFSAEWDIGDCGSAIAQCGEFIISVDTENVKAYTATNIRWDGEDGNKYLSDFNVKPLSISITDK